jgi:predicted anti-sigma-YlaC factor YlaD
MGNARCKWVCDRLPLLAGDDLQGLDRRRVERHLIGCPQCREHQSALGQVLKVLRTVATSLPAQPDAPSLWPALARQIRESRRPIPTPPLMTFPFVFTWLRVNLRPVFGFGVGLGLLVSIGASLAIRNQIDDAQAHIAANQRPIATMVAAPRPRIAESPAPSSRHELQKSNEIQVVETTTATSPPPPTIPISYEPQPIEQGKPMDPPAREPRDSNLNSLTR